MNMTKWRRASLWPLLLLFSGIMTACSVNIALQPTATPPAPTAEIAVSTATATAPAAPVAETTATATPPAAAEATATATLPPVAPGAEEAILIQEPGPGSRLTSPITIAGVADPTFEQNLVARLVLDDGTELALAPTTIAADVGQRGPFTVELPFQISGERQAFIQVYATSARDGGITHLASVGVTLTEAGPESVTTVEPHPERIMINQPSPGDTVSGGVVHVEGVGLASFEQSLLVELLDVDGNPLASQPVTVGAAELGQPGFFSADIPYSPSAAGPARLVVRDISPAFGGDVHRASVEITLEP